jgi:endo-1,4-beta-xylanase
MDARAAWGTVLAAMTVLTALPGCGEPADNGIGSGNRGAVDVGGHAGIGGASGTSAYSGASGSGASGGSGGSSGVGGTAPNPGGGAGKAGNSGQAGNGGLTSGGAGGSAGEFAGRGGAPDTAGRGADGGRSAMGGMGGTGRGGMGGMTVTAGMGGSASAGGPTNPGGFPEKFAGNIDTRGSIRSDFADYWDQFSPENAGKWGSVQPNNDSTFNWTSLDAMYKYANEHNIIFKQHNFIWGSQQPGWTANLTTSTGPAAVQNWMKAFCDRYPNTRLIDVVNEPPPHTTPKYLNAIGGSGSSGWDWIANAFKWARAACPNSILILNDYNNVEQAGDIQHTIDIVNAIKKAGAPIDAIGCQTHAASNLSSATLKANIDKLTNSTGLPVYITEYDLNISDDQKQASVLKDQFTMFWNHPQVKGITYWGYIVGSTWVANSGLIQSNGTARPAMTWLMDFLGR